MVSISDCVYVPLSILCKYSLSPVSCMAGDATNWQEMLLDKSTSREETHRLQNKYGRVESKSMKSIFFNA